MQTRPEDAIGHRAVDNEAAGAAARPGPRAPPPHLPASPAPRLIARRPPAAHGGSAPRAWTPHSGRAAQGLAGARSTVPAARARSAPPRGEPGAWTLSGRARPPASPGDRAPTGAARRPRGADAAEPWRRPRPGRHVPAGRQRRTRVSACGRDAARAAPQEDRLPHLRDHGQKGAAGRCRPRRPRPASGRSAPARALPGRARAARGGGGGR